MTLEYVLKKNGINPQTDLVLDDSIKFDLMAGAFAGGSAEYVTLFEPTASMTEDAGKGYIVASVGEASGEVPIFQHLSCRHPSFHITSRSVSLSDWVLSAPGEKRQASPPVSFRKGSLR